MSDEILKQQINDLINGTIGEDECRALQERLKSDSTARAVYCERLDLEAGLRTWAADGTIEVQPAASQSRPTVRPKHFWSRRRVTLLVTAASLLAIAFWWTQQPDPAQREVAEQPRQTDSQELTRTAVLIGRLVQQAGCVWQQAPTVQDGRFTDGTIELASGAAELRLDSGTNVILEGPCELTIEAVDSAQLLAGTIFVDVTEVSNGFVLETPEAQIVDEGTQYAVSLDSQATEVHVFDGSVIWTPTKSDIDFEDRIISGEARRFLRNEPGRSHHIPFGQRQFVRRIEEAVLEAGGGELLAYDGFENLAGQLRRGRSGFGWSGGWESAGRGRGSLAEVIDAPDDVVFGIDRSGRRLLSLRGGDNLRRQFEDPIESGPGKSVFVSLLMSRTSSAVEDDSSAQIVLEPDSASRRYQRRHSVSFGITSQGEPFLNNAGTIGKVAMELSEEHTYLVVLKYVADNESSFAGLRVYTPGSSIDLIEPTVWTEASSYLYPPSGFLALRIAAAESRDWQVDELKIGSSWASVVAIANEEQTDR